MASTEVIHCTVLIALAALFTSASAVPMMPLSYGLMGVGGGLFGGHGKMMGPGSSLIGASYNDETTYNGQPGGPLISPAQSPRVLNGVLRFFSEVDDSLKDGFSVIIQSSNPQEAETMGHHGAMGLGSPFGFGKGLMGGYSGVGMYGGLNAGLMGSMYGMGVGNGLFSPRDELEAVIDVVKPDDFTPTDALIVFTEPAITSPTAPCPAGPVLQEPLDSNANGLGGLGTYAGAHNMLAGFGSPFGVGPMSMAGLGMEPDFGVITKVPLKPGMNSFTVKGLGPFTDIRQLAGHGISFCQDVKIGPDGRAGCSGAIFSCVQLSFTNNPERL